MSENVTDKIDPNSASLRMTQAQPRRLKRGPIIAVIMGAIGVIIIAFAFAMLRTPSHVINPDDAPVPADDNRLPGFVKTGPKNYSEIPQPKPVFKPVPKLGPALEGDLGHAGLPAKTTTFSRPISPRIEPKNRELSPEEQQRIAKRLQAMEADVFFPGFNEKREQDLSQANQASAKDSLAARRAALRNRPAYSPDLSSLSQDDDWASQNQQKEKSGFLENYSNHSPDAYLKASISQPVSPYEVKAGTIIPTTLITGINSDLPGQIVGQVREHVYDTVTGHYLLVPQGTRIIGQYDSTVAFGQERVLVVWHRLILPNGTSISLEGMPGVDLSGYAGFKDKVNRHWLQLAGGVILSSLLSVAATSSQGNFTNTNVDLTQGFAANVGQDINRAGQKIVEKMLNRQPTLTIAPGFSVNVFVNKDMILEPYNAIRGMRFDTNFATD